MPRHRYNEALAFITGGLNDVSLSRAKLTWGVQVPWDPDQVFYVWFDALLNYVTALGYARDGEDVTERFWPATYHIIGKDILKFHTVFWPALLLAADLPLPEHVFVHGFLLMRDASGRDFKMSKSLGNVLDPFQIMEQFGTDALRYYCLREVSFGHDGAVSTAGFAARYEGELANELGNLASRTTSMAARYLDGSVPAVELDGKLVGELAPIPGEVAELLDRADLTGALEATWRAVRRLNRYVEEQAPWQLAKAGEHEALARVLATLVEGLRTIAVLLHPWIPASAEKILDALGAPGLEYASAQPTPGSARTVTRLAPLFPKPEGA
jgi:methionyl-tRNA synthetase